MLSTNLLNTTESGFRRRKAAAPPPEISQSDLGSASWIIGLGLTNISMAAPCIKTAAARQFCYKKQRNDELAATNRFCIPNQSPCITKWFLVSALSQRRMLVEGGYWSGEPPIKIRDRVNFSRDFGEKATYLRWAWLREHGVTWVFIDYAPQNSGLRSWEPFGTSMFSNDVASVVKLSQQLEP